MKSRNKDVAAFCMTHHIILRNTSVNSSDYSLLYCGWNYCINVCI